MLVTEFDATSATNLAKFRAGESFSPPIDSRVATLEAFSVDGMPWANRRMLFGSRNPLSPLGLPTISFVNIPCTSAPAAAICWAKNEDPNNPCSSPATAPSMTVALGGGRCARMRTSSMTIATPLASSSAPGASSVKLSMLVTRES